MRIAKRNTDDALKLFSQTNNTEGILAPDFDAFVAMFNNQVALLKALAPTPGAIDTMYSEDDQKRFIELFKALSKLMNSLQTFVEFSFERGKLDMTQQELSSQPQHQEAAGALAVLKKKNQRN